MPNPIVRSIDAPPMEPGAPQPTVTAADDALCLAYSAPDDERFRITFSGALVHYFGWPNDEVLHAHPMAAFGLGPYGAFEVLHSRWIEELRTLNRVHPRHNDASFDRLRHFIWTFHDNTFECLAEGFEVDGG